MSFIRDHVNHEDHVQAGTCAACRIFMPRGVDRCPNCKTPRPKPQTEAQRIARGKLPAVLRSLPLAPPGKPQRWRER